MLALSILVERESDRDGVRFYWTLLQPENGEMAAASARHYDDAEQAEAEARKEAATLGAEVDQVYVGDIESSATEGGAA